MCSKGLDELLQTQTEPSLQPWQISSELLKINDIIDKKKSPAIVKSIYSGCGFREGVLINNSAAVIDPPLCFSAVGVVNQGERRVPCFYRTHICVCVCVHVGSDALKVVKDSQ